ncbi:PorP/SprF family type IX secretion system membrane protein [Tunicatimonas pelagia]|uniref:PorP/SprF family type IX secretion system membrane protein n=1 Tax=Tunicatimonas pelagia TaxID=931531 RepID=UPI00266630CE|nr:PorP/SprF family type IX secretion system membrane protein [Tunicatimonas pelagia]WKN43934.1 PorP/SprF family type IX secretion system membrane protein [Tunicatimonas pelagia]
MKLHKLLYIALLVGATAYQSAYAQDPSFSQFYNARLYLNPAFAGTEENAIVSVTHRAQWNQIEGSYLSNQVTGVLPIRIDKGIQPRGHIGGIGVSVHQDQAGPNGSFRNVGGNLTFGYDLPIDVQRTQHLVFGLQTGFGQRSISPEGYQWGSTYNPATGQFDGTSAGVILNDKAYFDVSGGVLWQYTPRRTNVYYEKESHYGKRLSALEGASLGVAAYHLNTPETSMLAEGSDPLPMMFKTHGSVVLGVTEQLFVSGSAVALFQGEANQVNVGSFLTYRMNRVANEPTMLRVGGWYRFQDAYVATAEVQLPNFHVGFSYDMNTTAINAISNPLTTYEIFTAIRLNKRGNSRLVY